MTPASGPPTGRVAIRRERPGDAEAIRAVTVAAFEGSRFGHHNEADIIEALRAAGALTVSLVAVQDDRVVGHLACSPARIAEALGDWYGLGPLAVMPQRQGQGIGRALVEVGLSELRALKASGCVLLGDPGYYGRFGFESDPLLRYGPEPSPHFQRLILSGPRPRGEARFHPAFDI